MNIDDINRIKGFDHAQILEEFKDIAILKRCSELIRSYFLKEISEEEFVNGLQSHSISQDNIDRAKKLLDESIIKNQSKI